MITFKNILLISQFLCLILIVTNNKFQDNLGKTLQINGPFSEEEYSEIRRESQKLVDFLKDFKEIKYQNSQKGNRENSLLKSLRNTTKFENHTDNFICKTCLWSFTKFHNLMEKKYGLTIFNEFLAILCSIGLNHSVCHQAIDLYSPIIIDSLIEHYFDAEYICTKSRICKNEHFIELNPDDYAKELLKDKPAEIKLSTRITNGTTLKVLHVTDIHTDLSYTEGSLGLCPDPLCCREENGKAKTNQEYAGRWGFQGKCDIPLRTLDLFVETVVNDIKPDMIIWTGDNPPHNPWVDNKKEIYNITKVFIDLLYHKYNYSGPVFPSLGNHEENVADQYNPYEEKNEKEFLVKMGSLYRIWLSDSEYDQFIQTGYYTTLYKNTNLRIISINCFMCDVLNFYLIRNPTDPGNQFEWLENVLRDSEKNGEFVFIIGHIPPGDSTYLSQCSKRYNALVDRFSNIIRGQFYGHTHYDEFRIVKEYFNSTNIAGLILTAPSLTTYSFINPSFRIYDVDSDTKILKDYSQYRLNITEANITPDIKPQFKVAYTAKKAFNIEHLNDYNAIRDNILKMKNDDKWFDIATDIFYAQGIEKDNQVKNKRLPLYLTCRFKEDVFDEYFKCTGYRTWDYAEYINLFIESFSSKWYVKIYDDLENPHNNKNKKDLNFLS